jgi:hypothetical protein
MAVSASNESWDWARGRGWRGQLRPRHAALSWAATASARSFARGRRRGESEGGDGGEERLPCRRPPQKSVLPSGARGHRDESRYRDRRDLKGENVRGQVRVRVKRSVLSLAQQTRSFKGGMPH